MSEADRLTRQLRRNATCVYRQRIAGALPRERFSPLAGTANSARFQIAAIRLGRAAHQRGRGVDDSDFRLL